MIHLCEMLENGVISRRKKNNDLIRLVLGMSAEHAALRKSRRFFCARFAVRIPIDVRVGIHHVSLEVLRSSTAETIQMGVETMTGVLGMYLALSFEGRPIPNDIPLYCFTILENAQINATVIDAEEVDWASVRTHMATPASAPPLPAPVSMCMSIRNLLLASQPTAQPRIGTWKRPPVPRPTEAPAGVLQLTVKTMVGRLILLEVQVGDTAESVLEEMGRRTGMSAQNMRLVWLGRWLWDELKMYHFGLQGKEIVHLFQTMREG